MRKSFLLVSLSLISFNSFSDKNCEKSLSHQNILQTITNTIVHATQGATIFPIQRRIIRERLITPLGEIKQPYKGIIGQSLYAGSYHKKYRGIPNVDAAYKSVAPHLTQMELNRLRWSPPRKVKP